MKLSKMGKSQTDCLTFLKDSVVLFLSFVWLFVTPWIAACQAPPFSSVSWSLFIFMSIEFVMLSNHLVLCCPLLLSSILSQPQGLFHWVGSSHQVANVLELQLQYPASNEYSGLISFRMDWFDLLAIQGTLKSLLQHHSSNEVNECLGEKELLPPLPLIHFHIMPALMGSDSWWKLLFMVIWNSFSSQMKFGVAWV